MRRLSKEEVAAIAEKAKQRAEDVGPDSVACTSFIELDDIVVRLHLKTYTRQELDAMAASVGHRHSDPERSDRRRSTANEQTARNSN